MIRVLLGSAVPLIAISLAAAFVGPSLLASRGEPILVARPGAAALELADLDGGPCAVTRLLAGNALLHDGDDDPATRIVALALQSGPDHMSVAIQEIPPGGALPDAGATILLLLDASGRIVAIESATAHAADLAEPAMTRNCGDAAPITLGSI